MNQAHLTALYMTPMILLTMLGREPASASVLAQTQLAGLSGVNVHLSVIGDLQTPDAERLESALRHRVAEQMERAGLGLTTKGSEWLLLDVEVRRIDDRSLAPASLAVAIRARLREPVALRRNPALDVPGGGALTWWKDILLTCSQEALEGRVFDGVELALLGFIDEWKIENPQRR